MLYRISSTGRSNVCRNLHRLIHREGLSVPVKIDFIKTQVRKRRPLVKKVNVWHPVIYPSSWLDFLLKEHSYLLLGGHDLSDTTGWQKLLSDFWSLYKAYDEDHAMNGPNSPPASHTIPLYVHGDEGRGKYRLPVMVEGFQPCISFKGTAYKNSSGNLVAEETLFPDPFLHYIYPK